MQIRCSESELAHLHVRASEISSPLHFLKKLVGDGVAGLPVAGKQVKGLAFPAPVLHDLRGKFNEIPSDIRAAKTAHFDLAEGVVQKMAEFVEDCLDLAVSQQGRSVPQRGCQVPANGANVRKGGARNKPVHPRAAT